MAKPVYTQEVIMDANGVPIINALKDVEAYFLRMQKIVAGIGVRTEADAKKWGLALADNIALLKKAESDLRALQAGRRTRQKSFDDAETEVARRKLREAKAFFNEEERLRKAAAADEKRTAKEVADYEAALDREAIARTKELTAARREARLAAVQSGARNIGNLNEAQAAKAESDLRLRRLRVEREAAAQTNSEAARGLAMRIDMEKALGRELDSTIRKLNSQQEAATRRLTTARQALVPGNVRDTVIANGGDTKTTLLGYKFEQEAARQALQATLATANATDKQVASATERLRLANLNVAAARRLHAEEERIAQTEARLAKMDLTAQHRTRLALVRQFAREQIETLGPTTAIERAVERTAAAERALANATAAQRTEMLRNLELARRQEAELRRQGGPGGASPLENILSPGYAVAAFARTSVYGAAAAAAYGIFNAFSTAATSTVEFEDELAKLGAIADATEPQLVRLRASILEVASGSRFSVTELTKISQQLAQAGVAVGDTTKVLQSVLSLATASGSTPDEAVNLVTSALGSFQLQASEAGRIADLMTSALNRTKLTVPQVGQAIQYVGSTAYEQNISLEQLLATIGAIAQAGVKSGSTIGTGFRQFLVDLQTPSEKLTEQLQLLGLTTADVDVATRGLPAVLETLSKAGFGSAQAYASLETRAAAFYLTAKNNVQVMDQLQLAFATSGAAATANERAMNSLTAQWQRFKNNLMELTGGFMQQIIDDLKETITLFGDLLAQYNAYQRTKPGEGPTLKQRAASIAGYTAAGAGIGAAAGAPFAGVGAVPGAVVGGFVGFASGVEAQFTSTSRAVRDYATATADANAEVDKQTSLISELDQELSRLITQKASLRENDVRSSAEIATLSSRFEGLSNFLTATGSRYDDLVQAMERYRLKQLELLGMDLTAQQTALAQETAQARRERRQQITRLQGDSEARASLTKREQEALNYVQRFSGQRTDGTNDPKWQVNYEIVASASRRLAEDFPRLSKELNEVVQNLSKIAYNTAVSQNAEIQIANNRAARTGLGQQTQTTLRAVESIITLLGSAEGGRRDGLATRANSSLDKLEKTLRERLPKITDPGNRDFVNQALRDIGTLRQQVKAQITPTKAEREESERQARQASRNAPLPAVSISEIERILGVKATSGLRSVAENKRIGGAANSHHLTGNALDIPLRDRTGKKFTKSQIRAALEEAGVDIKELLGPGDKDHSDHFHIAFDKKRKGADQIAQQAERYNGMLDRNQLELDQEALDQSLKEMARATTRQTFEAAVAASKKALDAVNEDVETAAFNELAANDISVGDPEYEIKMRQVRQTIAQNVDAYQQKVAEALIKNMNVLLKAADMAFEKSLSSAEQAKQIADAQVSGLDYFSNRNNVPDYVRTLAQQRAERARETRDRVRSSQLPGYIAERQAALDETQSRLGQISRFEADGITETAAYQQTTAAIEAQVIALQNLRNEKAALDAGLQAAAQIPQTLATGLLNAMEAYKTANGLGRTFSQELILNMGGAIEAVNDNLVNMFQSIMDGSQTALQAFGNFAKGIMQYITQLVAKIIASKIIELLISVVGNALAPKVANFNVALPGPSVTTPVAQLPGAFTGGAADDMIYRAGGGEVSNGSSASDSVRAKLAKGEWVIQKKAVDSVGNDFMARFNQHGAKALDALNSVPSIDMKNHTETNVYVIPPEQRPSLGKDDVLVILQDEMMHGETKKLVQHISRES